MNPTPQPTPFLSNSQTGKPRQVESTTLFGACDDVLIAHDGETYRLRRTRQGKLILTK